ncbi:hypothetical protein ES677_01115 [Bizionia gelidisalsuginis]|uniref:Uncharacterized protein n=2 Tax=Bizionia TaxID=283785 RepID=A0A8H2LFR8_9FLAO|nr:MULTISPECIES: hypothetical protein [Bizionia]TYB77313.1 hypothetical protein ES676_03200 [Bizionia saleffrena]TYC18006.1 hypothetical protein ES677_01115 [Bizionia gelidisalsuginis]
MKNINIILVLISLFAFSCDNNDDEQTDPVVPTDGFTHNNIFFETPNAYFEIDEEDDDPNIGGDGFPDNYSFFFSNGRMFDNDLANVNGVNDDYLFSLNTTSWVFLNVEVQDNPSLANAGPLPNNTYVVSSIHDSVIIENGQIDALSPIYINNNTEFGIGSENVGIFNFPGPVGPSITFNAITIDNANPTESTVDVDYTFMNEDGEIITGHYEGTFGIILD